jgi:hypothetical protein
MLNSPHRIRRLRWVVSAGSVAEAFSIRKYLHNQWQDLLLSPFEKAFGEAANAEHIIHLPKIELRLKVTSQKQLIEVLPDLIHQQLREQLQSIFREKLQPNSQAVLWKESTVQQNRLDILLYYLRSGSVPWQATNTSTSEIAIELKETCRQQWPQLLDFLRNKHETATFYFRLFQLISEENFITLVSTLADSIPQSWITAVVQLITSLSGSEQRFFTRYTRLQLAAALLSESLRKRESNVAPDFAPITESVLAQEEKNPLNDFIASLPASAAVLLQQDKRTVSKVATDSSAAAISEIQEVTETDRSLPPSAAELLQQDKRTGSKATTDSSAAAISEIQEVTETERSLPPSAAGLLQQKTASKATADSSAAAISEIQEVTKASHPFDGINQSRTDTEPGILQKEISQTPFQFPIEYPLHDKQAEHEFPLLINHAGLILLHPFITRFFENTGIKEAGIAQLSSFVTARAAALLHFLATGREDVYEYELGFIKILLGLPPEVPLLVAEGLIKPDDKEEAEALLQSVISYWSILKNTSVQGLRSSFLQRQGLLREDENGWRLQVETMPFDMLLDQLPWGISIVKLPWMQKPIYTEWSMP